MFEICGIPVRELNRKPDLDDDQIESMRLLGRLLKTERPWGLYRHYSGSGRLLYVGITQDLERRWKEHFRNARPRWPDDVDLTTVEWFHWQAPITTIEADAIAAEQPIYNRRRRWR